MFKRVAAFPRHRLLRRWQPTETGRGTVPRHYLEGLPEGVERLRVPRVLRKWQPLFLPDGRIVPRRFLDGLDADGKLPRGAGSPAGAETLARAAEILRRTRAYKARARSALAVPARRAGFAAAIARIRLARLPASARRALARRGAALSGLGGGTLSWLYDTYVKTPIDVVKTGYYKVTGDEEAAQDAWIGTATGQTAATRKTTEEHQVVVDRQVAEGKISEAEHREASKMLDEARGNLFEPSKIVGREFGKELSARLPFPMDWLVEHWKLALGVGVAAVALPMVMPLVTGATRATRAARRLGKA